MKKGQMSLYVWRVIALKTLAIGQCLRPVIVEL
jgi:hypothetical protein